MIDFVNHEQYVNAQPKYEKRMQVPPPETPKPKRYFLEIKWILSFANISTVSLLTLWGNLKSNKPPRTRIPFDK